MGGTRRCGLPTAYSQLTGRLCTNRPLSLESHVPLIQARGCPVVYVSIRLKNTALVRGHKVFGHLLNPQAVARVGGSARCLNMPALPGNLGVAASNMVPGDTTLGSRSRSLNPPTSIFGYEVQHNERRRERPRVDGGHVPLGSSHRIAAVENGSPAGWLSLYSTGILGCPPH